MRLRHPRRDEAEAVLAVCVARDVADLGRPDTTLEDVVGDWDSPAVDIDEDCWVVEGDDGSLLGYAVIDYRAAMVSVHPDAEGRGVGTLLREAVETRAAERGQPSRIVISASNTAASGHLAAAGYERAHVYPRMRIADLADAPPRPPGPEPRLLDLDTEAHVAHELVEDAFAEIPGTVRESFEIWIDYVRRTSEPAFRLVIDDEEGIAAAVLGERWEDGVGYVGMVAVAPRARGRGYGKILLLGLFEAFRAEGLTSAELSVSAANAPATGLYESVGMTEIHRSERWERSER